tara:strand:+ start:209 stop:406 length:198 start_codon:yes stop_codon:yes gene_type:complete
MMMVRRGYNCLVYLDDELLDDGQVQMTHGLNEGWLITLNGIPVEPVGDMVVDDEQKRMTWRFKTV